MPVPWLKFPLVTNANGSLTPISAAIQRVKILSSDFQRQQRKSLAFWPCPELPPSAFQHPLLGALVLPDPWSESLEDAPSDSLTSSNTGTCFQRWVMAQHLPAGCEIAWRGEAGFCTPLHASYLLDEYIRSNDHGTGRQELLWFHRSCDLIHPSSHHLLCLSVERESWDLPAWYED